MHCFKEFKHASTNMMVFVSLPSKSMPYKSNHDFKGKCPYIHVGTIEPMCINHIMTESRVFAEHQRFKIRVRHIMTKR